MSLDTLKIALRQLSYTDMKALSVELSAALQKQSSTTDGIAEALLSLPVSVEKPESMEEPYFRKAFSRTRTLSIRQLPGGWEVECSSINGATAAHPSLRETVSRVLDTIVGLKALEK